MKRTPISFYDVCENRNRYNSNNLARYDPYVYDASANTLFIDCDWWNELTPFARNLMSSRMAAIPNVTLRCDQRVAVPHEYQKHSSELCIYRSYIDAHDYDVWCDELTGKGCEEVKDVEQFLLSSEEKRQFAMLARKRLAEAKPIEDNDKLRLKPLLDQIGLCLGDCTTPRFLRLSGTSGKNEVAVEPVYTVDDVLRRLTSNMLFLHQEYEREDKETCIILMPWLDRIEKRNEFRVFVCGGRITGVSQQHWQDLFNYADAELDTVEKSILGAPFLTQAIAPYRNFVADVWVSFDDAVCHLIEYNPFGAQSGAGSSLFEWHRDYDLLYGRKGAKELPELRFASLLLY